MCKKCESCEYSQTCTQKNAGRPRYGSKPSEKQLIERVTQLRTQNLSYAKIATILNEEGYRTRKSTPIGAMMVWNIINSKQR